MAVSQRRQTPPHSPPNAKRVKKKELKQLACIESKKSESSKRKKAIVPSFYGNWTSTMGRAEEVRSNLAPEFPSFVKVMLPSHVTGGFWLGLPRKFCGLHLPKHDAMIVLEDEDGNISETKFLAEKTGLSGGWRGFSIAHKLVESDVLVFHLVTPFKFKVYIIRSNGSDEVDCALGLLKLEARSKQVDTMDIAAFDVETETLKALLEDKSDDDDDVDKNQRNCIEISDQSDKDSGDISPEVSDGIRLSGSVVAFKEVRSLDDFEILVNGLVINSELSRYLQGKYYELCYSQKMFLHENLLDGLNCKLIAGIISETINIADAIKASKITSSDVDAFSIWDKTLKAFEGLGMNVGFLLARLDQLANLATKSERYENVRAERDSARDEVRNLEAKILAAKERVTRLDAEFETLRANQDELEAKFKEAASAAW